MVRKTFFPSFALIVLACITTASSAQQKHNDTLFIIRYTPGKNYDSTKTVYQQDLRAHAAYMKQLLTDGYLVFAGPLPGEAGGQLILDVINEAAALDIMSKDPAIVKEVFKCQISKWDIRFARSK